MAKLSSGKRRLVLVQSNNRYGSNVYLPYSVGLLWAYAQTVPGVAEAWELDRFIYLKEPIDKALARIEHEPSLVAISCYIWNWRWSLAFAEAAKTRWPYCKILVGGVQIPDESTATLDDHPFIDYAIYGEGEGPFAELLLALDRGWDLHNPGGPMSRVGNLAWRETHDHRLSAVVNKHRSYADIDKLRSPYLDGVFDPILNDGWKWQALQETNRGCPYACTFCAWGAAALNRVRPLDMDRVLAEIDWFADHKCGYIDNCDANFGILPRDTEIVDALIRSKRDRGFPEQFRTSWAKNSNAKVFDMARRLHGAGMLKAVTLSMQSMDTNVLTLIKRKNIKYDNLSSLLDQYGAEDIPTYTELIMGLPGETLETYIDGIDRVLDAGQHDGLFCYPCLLLPNTEMAHPDHVREHGIESVTMKAMLSHGTPEPDVIGELQDIVIATKTMPHEDWKRSYYFSWAIQVFHVLGLTQHVAKELRGTGTRYGDFYRSLLSWIENAYPSTVAHREFSIVRDLLSGALRGGSWDLVDPRFGDISWPPEEYSFLKIVSEADRFYDELRDYFPYASGMTVTMADEFEQLVRAQRDLLVRPEPGREAEYARENVWYGRKGSGAKKRRKEAAA